jgi:5-methylthioadenosine/S-adenosylhomocysteine deaminase
MQIPNEVTLPLTLVDLIIEAKWIAVLDDDSPLLEHHAVVVRSGLIVDLLSIADSSERYQAREIICLDEHVLIPGLINLHTHAAMSLMRGIADDLPLMVWLNDHIWPTERAVVMEDYVKDASLHACAEMLGGGITCFNDMYFYPKATAAAVNQAGMRACLGLFVSEFATKYAVDADDYLQKGFEAHDSWRGSATISSIIAPHAPYTVTDKTFEKVVVYAEQLGLGIHTHLHETRQEIAQGLDNFGIRPIQRLSQLGLLGPGFLAAHGVHLLPQEMDLLHAHGCNIAHCPSSNLKLGSGIAPTATLLEKQVNIGLGTDGAASNNRLDMFAEMRMAALLAKGLTEDPTVLPAYQVLKMATINAAKALGLEDKIGSITIGKQADFAAVKLSDTEVSPCYDPISHLVYTCGREHVTHTWVAGELKYSHGIYANIEPIELKEIVKKWQLKLTPHKH